MVFKDLISAQIFNMQPLLGLLDVDRPPDEFSTHVNELCRSLGSLSQGSQVARILHQCLAHTSSPDESHTHRLTRMLVDICWEKLHTGHWSKVEAEWRHAYALSCLLHAATTSTHDDDRMGSAMRLIDLGIMMGGGSPFRSYLDQAMEKLERKMSSALSEPLLKRRRLDSRDAVPSSASLSSLPPNSLSYLHYSLSASSTNPKCPKSSPPLVLDRPSIEEFLVNLMPRGGESDVGTPAIIEGMMEGWPAMSRWQDLRYLLDSAGHRTVPVELGRSYHDEEWGQSLMPLREFISKHVNEVEATAAGQGEGSSKEVIKTGYLAQHPLFEQIPSLKRDLIVPDYCCLSTRATGEEEGPGGTLASINAWIGPEGTLSPLHHDPHDNLLCQVKGFKYVRLYSPTSSPGSIYPQDTPMINNSKVDLIRDAGPTFAYPDHPGFNELQFFDLVLHPGQILYIPPKWWHYCQSLSVSISVSFWWD
jgi:hypothetical protein